MKPNEQAQIDFIVDCLRNGEQRNVIMGKFGKKWEQVSRTTFDRRLQAAQRIASEEIDNIKARAGESINAEIEARKLKILTVAERIDILTKMALGELESETLLITKDGIKKAKLKPTHNERRAAIAELNKMDGSYAPTKTDVTISAEPELILPGKPDEDVEPTAGN